MVRIYLSGIVSIQLSSIAAELNEFVNAFDEVSSVHHVHTRGTSFYKDYSAIQLGL